MVLLQLVKLFDGYATGVLAVVAFIVVLFCGGVVAFWESITHGSKAKGEKTLPPRQACHHHHAVRIVSLQAELPFGKRSEEGACINLD